MSVNIIKQTGTANTTYAPGRKIEWLVIHYSASTSSKRGAASGMCSWSGNPSAGGSADFAVDDETMYQYNGDIENRYCWAVGGSKYTSLSTSLSGKYHGIAKNSNCISIELSSNKTNKSSMNVTDNDWYLTDATIDKGVELAVYLMKKYNINMEHVITHAMITGKWCPQPWFKNESALQGWYNFRKKLQKAYDGTEYVEEKIYRVRKDWKDEKSQLFAGTLEGAKRIADENPGYLVYDPDGNVLYGTVDATSTAAPTTEASGLPYSKEDYLKKVSDIAVDLYKETRILPSVVIAQCCLETGFGLGSDSTELVKRNNLIGLKADLINNTWKDYTVWDGTSFKKRTPEVYNGVATTIIDSFRIYKNYRECIYDYEMFLTHVQNNNGYKYRKVVGMTDPKAMITHISQNGYASDPSYITKIMRLINDYNMTKYDIAAGVSVESEYLDIKPVQTDYYRVAKEYKDGSYIGQTGAYTSKERGISAAKSSGLKCFDPNGKQIYPEKVEEVPANASKYRVRLGKFLNATYAEALMFSVKEKLGLDCFSEKENNETCVYCGSFTNKNNAEQRANTLNKAGFETVVI